MSHIIKLIIRILLNRGRRIVRLDVEEEESCLVKSNITRNSITMFQIISQMQKAVHLSFTYYAETFVKLGSKDYFELLGNVDLFQKDVRIIPRLYWEARCLHRERKRIEYVHKVERIVKQVCLISPDLFNGDSEAILLLTLGTILTRRDR